jgi:hypothetical protein
MNLVNFEIGRDDLDPRRHSTEWAFEYRCGLECSGQPGLSNTAF